MKIALFSLICKHVKFSIDLHSLFPSPFLWSTWL